jgi:hypothetical protein
VKVRFAILLVLAASPACSKRVPAPIVSKSLPHVGPQPVTPIVPPSAPAPVLISSTPSAPVPELPSRPVAPDLVAFDEAGIAFAAADYPRAINRYEEYLKLAPNGERRDQALFQLGLVFALQPQPQWNRSITHFKELLSQHPTSHLAAQAQLLVSMQTQIIQLQGERDKQAERARQLGAELERVKRIDLDGLKRAPTQDAR